MDLALYHGRDSSSSMLETELLGRILSYIFEPIELGSGLLLFHRIDVEVLVCYHHFFLEVIDFLLLVGELLGDHVISRNKNSLEVFRIRESSMFCTFDLCLEIGYAISFGVELEALQLIFCRLSLLMIWDL